jgi:hypothetical protein
LKFGGHSQGIPPALAPDAGGNGIVKIRMSDSISMIASATNFSTLAGDLVAPRQGKVLQERGRITVPGSTI